MTPEQALAEFEMDSIEEDRKTWEMVAAVLALTVAAVVSLLLPLGPLLY